MATSTDLRQAAEAKFKKRELERLDGCAAMAEYEAASRATLEKTARLRALRLSRAVNVKPTATKPEKESPAKKRAGKASV